MGRRARRGERRLPPHGLHGTPLLPLRGPRGAASAWETFDEVAVDAATPPAQDHVGDVKKKCKSLTEKYESRGVAFHCVHKEDVAGALAGIFTMGIAMNDDKVYLVVTQKDASA